MTVTTARTAGNTGLSVTGGSSLTFTPANFATAQGVTFTADSSSTGSATFTVSATGYPSITITVTETSNTGGGGHVADPFAGSKPYLNPDYVKEVQAQATADGSSAEAAVAKYQTAIWLDTISAIAGGGSTGRTGLQAQLTAAAAAGTAATPSLVEIVIYDLPGRDCAALASNGEIPATTAGLTEYETQYIDPIASILSQFATSNIRVVAIIEPDSLPNVVTNQSIAACSTATPLYEAGITYALNKLHAISNVYNYMDIAHSAWLGWPNNMSATPAVYNKVVQATTAGYASIDGFISDTANYTPTQEPLLTNPTLQINGQNVDSATFYQFNPTFDELTYDTQMYNTLVAAGFPSSKKFLIDTSRNGWGPTHPTTITSASDVNTYVADNKIDKRPFRGDWCNQNNAGIGARPTDQPFGSSSPILAFVWIKPPGESDGDYPTSTHTHGDPHCDPNGHEHRRQRQHLLHRLPSRASMSRRASGSLSSSRCSSRTLTRRCRSDVMTRTRRILSGLAALALSAAGLGASALTATPANAATGCSVSYTVPSQWNTGFTANIVITNLGSPLTSWNLGYGYSGNQTLQSGWNGTWTQSGANVTVANAVLERIGRHQRHRHHRRQLQLQRHQHQPHHVHPQRPHLHRRRHRHHRQHRRQSHDAVGDTRLNRHVRTVAVGGAVGERRRDDHPHIW